MGKSVNKVILLGNVGSDPQIRKPTPDFTVAEFSLATSERQKDKQGSWQDRTEWHSLVAMGRNAELIRDYVRKGTRLYIEGRLETRSWEDKSGQKKSVTQVRVATLVFGDSAARERESEPEPEWDEFR